LENNYIEDIEFLQVPYFHENVGSVTFLCVNTGIQWTAGGKRALESAVVWD